MSLLRNYFKPTVTECMNSVISSIHIYAAKKVPLLQNIRNCLAAESALVCVIY